MPKNTVGPCLVRFCVVRIWIVRVLKNTPDLHSAYYGFLAFSDHLYYSGTCVVRFYTEMPTITFFVSYNHSQSPTQNVIYDHSQSRDLNFSRI